MAVAGVTRVATDSKATIKVMVAAIRAMEEALIRDTRAIKDTEVMIRVAMDTRATEVDGEAMIRVAMVMEEDMVMDMEVCSCKEHSSTTLKSHF